jgi:probable rRNA maturation factor
VIRLVRFFVRQRAVTLERALWRRLARSLLEELLDRQDYELGVHFISAAEMARLNETFLAHEGSTDVLTFNHQEDPSQGHLKFSRPSREGRAPRAPENLRDKSTGFRALESNCPRLYGEIFISVDDALIYARRYRVRWQQELARYLIHGLLHLKGYDDTSPAARRAMKRRENSLVKALSAQFNLGKLGRL